MIFLSYSWQYASAARRVDDHLRSHGHSVWIDFRNLNTDAELAIEIDEAIARCSVFLLLRKADVRPTRWMEAEREIASCYSKPIFQIILPDADAVRNYRVLPFWQLAIRQPDIGDRVASF